MKIAKMEQCDKFDDNEYVCWVEVKEIPDQFIQEAKEIDGKNYEPTCFGICVEQDETGWFVYREIPECDLYYIENYGNRCWMKYVLSEKERNEAIEFCKNYIKENEGQVFDRSAAR